MVKKFRKGLSVVKSTGEEQTFSEIKLANSLARAGATKEQIKKILHKLGPQLFSGITTRKIYRMAFQQLRRESQALAANYSLKKALMELGPTGFPFEIFCAKVMESMGYEVNVGEMREGCCVAHEIDVIATKNGKTIFAECKFHNTPGKKNDIKTALYINSRKLDLEQNKANQLDEFWIFTNTTFSKDASTYGECVGLKLVGIDAGKEYSLDQVVRRHKLYPITSLRKLKSVYKDQLIEKGILLCKEVLEKPRILKKIGLSDEECQPILQEIKLFLYTA